MELTTRRASFAFVESGVSICASARIPHVLGPKAIVDNSFCIESTFSMSVRISSMALLLMVILLPCPSLLFHCFISVTGAFSFHVGAHGWVARICQPWERSPSRSWLSTVETPGCLRQPTSTLH